MGVKLVKIKGTVEVPQAIVNHPEIRAFKDAELQVSSFYGGKARGVCIQLTLNTVEPYIQLDRKAVDKLIDRLRKWTYSLEP
jgi:hypothetical protein